MVEKSVGFVLMNVINYGRGKGEMTFDEFNLFQQKLLEEVVCMRDTKGKEYANSKDRFANFNRLANQLDMTNLQVAWVYLAKHLDSIASYCRNGKTFSTESIRGRFVDAITYLTLMAGMDYENCNKITSAIKVINPELPYTLVDMNTGKHQPMEYDPTPSNK